MGVTYLFKNKLFGRYTHPKSSENGACPPKLASRSLAAGSGRAADAPPNIPWKLTRREKHSLGSSGLLVSEVLEQMSGRVAGIPAGWTHFSSVSRLLLPPPQGSPGSTASNVERQPQEH